MKILSLIFSLFMIVVLPIFETNGGKVLAYSSRVETSFFNSELSKSNSRNKFVKSKKYRNKRKRLFDIGGVITTILVITSLVFVIGALVLLVKLLILQYDRNEIWKELTGKVRKENKKEYKQQLLKSYPKFSNQERMEYMKSKMKLGDKKVSKKMIEDKINESKRPQNNELRQRRLEKLDLEIKKIEGKLSLLTA